MKEQAFIKFDYCPILGLKSTTFIKPPKEGSKKRKTNKESRWKQKQ